MIRACRYTVVSGAVQCLLLQEVSPALCVSTCALPVKSLLHIRVHLLESAYAMCVHSYFVRRLR